MRNKLFLAIHHSYIYLLINLALFFPVATQAQDNEINMVITAAFVSEKGLPVYEKIAKYIANKLNRKVGIISGRSYRVSDLLLDQGIVQVGFICGLPYVEKSLEKKYKLIAMPVMAMKKDRFPDAWGYEDVPGKYYSYTIVHKDSKLNSWQDLKGKTFVYNEQNSNSGYNMPRYKLVQMGIKRWEDYFSRILVSGSHENSIRYVAEGIVDASSVDSLVLDYDRHIGNKHALNVKVIEHLFPGGAGIPPVVLSSKSDPALLKEIQQVLVNMHKDVKGKIILEQALISHFAIAPDENYDDIRRMVKAAQDSGFIDHKL